MLQSLSLIVRPFVDNTGRSSSRPLSRRLNRGINYERWTGQDVANAKGRVLPSARLTFVNLTGSLPTLRPAAEELKQLTSRTCSVLAVSLRE